MKEVLKMGIEIKTTMKEVKKPTGENQNKTSSRSKITWSSLKVIAQIK